jgi:hypothetical protein
MKLPTHAALVSLLGASLALAGCGGGEREDPVPEGVSLEPPVEAPATGGVVTPGSTAPDSVVPAGGTSDTAGVATGTPGAAPAAGADTSRTPR